jgi:phosphotransferase system enzyme I (PtsI)
MDDAHLGAREGDIKDVGKRLVQNLGGTAVERVHHLEKKSVLIAEDLAPSETAQLELSKISGFATEQGGPTSHTAIIARTLELPAIVGLGHATAHARTGDTVILDGSGGVLIIDPDKETLALYRARQKEEIQKEQALRRLWKLPSVTRDGIRLHLAGNIDLPEEAKQVAERGAEGVGLFRTEFLFLNRPNLPTEEEQFQAYRLALKSSEPHPVTVRTLDLGGDKFLAHLGLSSEMNPFLGLRAIRLCLAHPYVFKVQLRAMLRASHYGPLKIMYPLISGVEELRQANQILEEVKRDLAKRGIPFDANLETGAMIEVPSAALTADILCKEVKFFSIGTNDLIQYTMAVDRGNQRIAYLYDPLHPAILRTVRYVVEEARKHKVKVAVCGEMGGDPLFALVLMGLGVDELSMSAASLPLVKKAVRLSMHQEAESVARQALKLATAGEIRAFLASSAAGKLLESL